MTTEKVTEHAVMCYVAQFMDAVPVLQSRAQLTELEGEGLVHGVDCRKGTFHVNTAAAGAAYPGDEESLRPKVHISVQVEICCRHDWEYGLTGC